MAQPTPPSGPASDIDVELRKLEVGIRQLKVHYDMFFAGSLKREPIELRTEIDRAIKRQANAPNQKFAQRFLLNSLIGRYNSLSELWAKTVRAREEGSRPAAAVADLEKPHMEQLVARCRVRGAPAADDPGLRRLYDRFLETRRRLGGAKREVSFEKFLRGVSGETARLRKQSGCGEIELRVVVHDHKVLLKARPGR
jgi:hypothetical protein